MRRLPLIIPCFILLVAAGCASGPRVGSAVPAFSAPDSSGEFLIAPDPAGRVVVYYFWATWCGPCVTASPVVQDLVDRFAAEPRVEVVGVHYDGAGEPREYLREHGYSFRLVPDGSAVVEALGVGKIPSIVVVDAGGVVTHHQIGVAAGDGDSLAGVVAEALEIR